MFPLKMPTWKHFISVIKSEWVETLSIGWKSLGALQEMGEKVPQIAGRRRQSGSRSLQATSHKHMANALPRAVQCGVICSRACARRQGWHRTTRPTACPKPKERQLRPSKHGPVPGLHQRLPSSTLPPSPTIPLPFPKGRLLM